MEAEKYHIMMFPWLAFGHMIPFFELSKRLAAKGVLVSYVSTPRNLHRLPPIPSPLQPKMKLLEIQMLPVDGLPENCEATLDLQEEQVPLLKIAYDILAEPFEHLLQSGPRPDFILVNFAPYWISLVAVKFGIRIAYFSVYTAATLAYLGPPAELKSVKRCPSPEVDRRGDPMSGVRNGHVPDASGVSTCQRLGKIRLAYFLRCLKRTRTRRAAPTPFIWILRKPQGVDSSDLLPPGFANRTLSQGVVVLGWAPQQEILAHRAIGGCLFHSGWGTAVESLVHGHPLVLLPMVADQGLTAKLLVEKQVGYEVPRGEDGSFSRDLVVESIRRVLVEDEGEQLRLKDYET